MRGRGLCSVPETDSRIDSDTGSEAGYYVDTEEALERNYTLSMYGHWSYNTLAYKDSMDIRIFVISFSGVGYILCRLEASCPGSRIGCCGD